MKGNDPKYKYEQGRGFKDRIKRHAKLIERTRNEIKKVVIGQEEMINDVLRAIIAGGHVLLEGVPGLAKTLLVRTVSRVSGGKFVRIQFTPDLLPSDLVGMSVYRPQTKRFEIVKGPVFSNFVLADEINRASPKVQSALLECMQEKQVTIAGKTMPVPRPFFVLATQNPIETLGTYPLPEAQVDRFMFKVLVSYPKFNDEVIILENNVDVKKFKEFKLKRILELSHIAAMQEDVRKIYIDPILKKYIVRLTDATRNPEKYNIKLGKYIKYGGSPRMSIYLLLGARAEALMNGKTYVTPHFIRNIALQVMRHRVILKYEAIAEEISSDDVINEILKKVPVP